MDTSANGDIRLDCKACGSSYYETYSYDDQGRLIGSRKEINNTLNDNNARYLEEVCEYTYDAVTGEQTGFREYVRRIHSDGRETWSERLETPYVGPFGEPGRESIERSCDPNGNIFEKSHAYVCYKGYNYTIYSYRKDSQKGYEWWERSDFTYTFDKECLQTEVYTNSNGDTTTNVNNCCYYEWGAVIQAPTCSQDGLIGNYCPVCMNSGETDTIKALDHNWVWLSNNLYHCARCGLENANGVSGDVVLEDLSAAYGNGENYVAGYQTWSYVDFSWYVSLILPTGEEIIVDGVKFIELDGMRAVAFSKAEVAAWASKMGYTDYDVRFSFVPVGSDGSFDYGLTFAAKTAGDVGVITDDVSFTDYIGVGEVKTYTITPTESGQWYFISCSNGDTCATLYSSYGKELAYSDDNASGNFRIDYYLKAGQTYTIEVRWNDSNAQGSLVLLFGAEKTVTEEKPEEDKPEGECNHYNQYTNEVPATCTEDGYKEDVCKDCGLVLYRENWKSNGHMFDEKGVCMNCGASEGDVNEEDKPEGECDHKNQYTNEVPATCTMDGFKEEICKDCGMVLYRENWKSNGHMFDEKGICMNCGASEGETGEATEADLSKQIEEAVSTAQRVWGELADMGVSRSVLKTYQAQYDLIVESMQNADSFESLEKCQQQFDEMIAKITATL